ncbi:MAG TPA: TIGR03066 family protein [Gemmataceae bacterium]|nr:TIGR03066 family protein [Gemmataceae bacterium]
MRTILGAALVVLMGLAAGAAQDDKKDSKIDGKKLVGKWTPKDAKKEAGLVIEFTKDGKLVLTVDIAGKTEKVEGTYKLDGNKLTMAIKFGDKENKETMTVLKLTDDELETEDSNGKKETLLRVKAK